MLMYEINKSIIYIYLKEIHIMKKRIINDTEIIEANQKWFNFLIILPKLLTILFALACFVLGIIFVIDNEPIVLLIFWGGGAVFCADSA